MNTSSFKSFLEVKPGSDCIAVVNEQEYSLGHVEAIYATHPKYIVWFDQAGQIWYEIDHSEVTLDSEFHDFWESYQTLARESLHNLSDAQKRDLKEMRASALSSALESQFRAANATLISAGAFIRSINERAAKKRYLAGVVISAFVAAITASILYTTYYYLQVDQVVQFSAHALAGGAIGTILSSTTGRIDDARFDPNASHMEGFLNGALRVLYGFCGALVAIVALKTGLIDSKLVTKENERYAFFLIAVAGGFAERFAANILTRMPNGKKQEASPGVV